MSSSGCLMAGSIKNPLVTLGAQCLLHCLILCHFQCSSVIHSTFISSLSEKLKESVKCLLAASSDDARLKYISEILNALDDEGKYPMMHVCSAV